MELSNILNKKQFVQRTNEWYNIRKNIVTATDASIILNMNQYSSKKDLILKKNTEEKNITNNAINWGIKYEPVAIDIFSKIFNVKIYEVGLFIHDKFNWLGASPDGIFVYMNEICLIEIKCVYNRNITNIPDMYWIQMQIQMEVCNIDKCYIYQCKFEEVDVDDYIKFNKYKGKINNKYWILKESNYKIINRDKEWFNKNKDKLYQFWKELQYTKTNNINNKRKLEEIIEPLNKKTRDSKIQYNIYKYTNNIWVSPSMLINYLNDDPLLDWLNKYGNKKDKDIIKKEYDFNDYIKNKGKLFEQNIIDNIKKRFNNYFIDINNYSNKNDYTIKSMEEGIPIIYNGFITNHEDYTYGIPDLIVRSDYLSLLISNDTFLDNNTNIGCKFSKSWHYRIIDIKYITLHLDKDLKNIKNKSSNINIYKSQILLYNNILSIIQDYNPNISYLLGYKYNINNIIYNSFYILGSVKTIEHNNIIMKYKNGIKWLNRLYQDGHKWDFTTSNMKELMPNMNNTLDYPWHSVKTKIAIQNKEISLLYGIGNKNRRLIHNNNKFKWNELDYNNIETNKKTKKIIKNIININNNNIQPFGKELIQKINSETNISELFNNKEIKFFVDFETSILPNNNFNNIKNYNKDDNCIIENKTDVIIYIIGTGFTIPETNKWYFKYFISDRLDIKSEDKIINEWLEWITITSKQYNSNNPYFIHWSQAEPVCLNRSLKRMNKNININWYDLLNLFKNVPIVIKETFNYSLKNIASSLYKLGYITTKWDNRDINGLTAIVAALYADKECNHNNNKLNNIKYIIDDIILYNEIDCKVLWDIYNLIHKIYISN